MRDCMKNTDLNPIRELIISLHKKNLSQADIWRRLNDIKVSKSLISRTISRYKTTGQTIPAKTRKRKRVKRTPAIIKVVRERLRRNPARSGRQLAKELNMSYTSMQKVIKLPASLTKQKIAGLTDKNKVERVKPCKSLLKRHGGADIVFSDEKMFTLEHPLNRQNDRVYAVKLSDVPLNVRPVPRYQNASAVMVFGAISKKGKFPLKFIDRGVKINKEYYLQNVIKDLIEPKAKEMYGDDPWVFQQDSAPAHKAIVVQDYCKQNFPDFIDTKEWLASIPDLNPLDFFVWGYMLQELGKHKLTTLDQFKELLIDIWDKMPQETVRAACENFFKRCRACIKAEGDRFELNQ
ncbi:uncharacterized protein LOC124814903 [Hydra vulgaris]|uniref:uncharacterized protein LOC124814903 n=1 Tax=Hydra vulgaris TaxID=6087 RepID=UPI0001926A87|nr:uncharacterized protein LOC124814903 [Hydra vulgaris]